MLHVSTGTELNIHESIHNLMVIQPWNWLMAYADSKTIENSVLVPMKFLHPERFPSDTNMEQWLHKNGNTNHSCFILSMEGSRKIWITDSKWMTFSSLFLFVYIIQRFILISSIVLAFVRIYSITQGTFLIINPVCLNKCNVVILWLHC